MFLMNISSLTPFEGHNIRLDDGTETLPGRHETMDRHPVLRSTLRALRTIYPQGLDGRTIIDLGCLEGGFTTEFARAGMHATGVEVRDSNYRNCLYVRDHVATPNLHFLQGDANDVDQYGPFDVFFVSGLLYHLDRPRAFLEAVARNCGKALVLWSHVAPSEPGPVSTHYNLSYLEENEGLHGRWYAEYDDVTRDKLDDQLRWASWNNRRSFWIQKSHLLELLRDLGFDLVLEQYDWLGDMVHEIEDGQHGKLGRVVLIAVKTGSQDADGVVWHRSRPLPPEAARTAEIEAIRAAEAEAADGQSRRDRQHLAELEHRVAVQQAAIQMRDRELEAIRRSTSWRVTGPLRSMVDAVRGRTGKI